MYLALGCALGVEALHAYSPDLCHRDIKSFNFLSKLFFSFIKSLNLFNETLFI